MRRQIIIFCRFFERCYSKNKNFNASSSSGIVVERVSRHGANKNHPGILHKHEGAQVFLFDSFSHTLNRIPNRSTVSEIKVKHTS